MGVNFLRAGALVISLALIPSVAFGQQSVQPFVINGGGGASPITTCPVGSGAAIACPMPVTGTFSASLAGFNPTAGATANISDIVNVSQDVALPAGADITVTNKGSVTINFRLQAGAGTAVSTDQALVAGAAAGFHITTATHLSAIAPTGTSTGATAGQLNIQGGTGLVTGYGGGSSSGGGSGGAVTIADGADVTLGAKADAKSTATDTTPITAMSVLKQISASVQAPPSQAVTNAGTFAVQLTGATNNINNVAGTVSLPTGASTSALQSTGNTSLATIATNTGAATPAGSAIIGKISQVDSAGTDATDTTLHAVKVNVVSATGVAQGSTSSGQTISPIGVRTLAAPPTDTTAQTNMPVADINGNLRNSLSASTWGGLTFATVTAAASTNATNLKASAGQLYHLTAYNNSATLAWVSLYNTAGTPTCGTGIVYQVMIPANSTSGAGAVDDIPSGLAFGTGIGYCITTGIAGTGSVAASTYVVNFGYK